MTVKFTRPVSSNGVDQNFNAKRAIDAGNSKWNDWKWSDFSVNPLAYRTESSAARGFKYLDAKELQNTIDIVMVDQTQPQWFKLATLFKLKEVYDNSQQLPAEVSALTFERGSNKLIESAIRILVADMGSEAARFVGEKLGDTVGGKIEALDLMESVANNMSDMNIHGDKRRSLLATIQDERSKLGDALKAEAAAKVAKGWAPKP